MERIDLELDRRRRRDRRTDPRSAEAAQLYEAIGRGRIPHRRIGKQIRLSRAALVQWLGDAWSLRVAEQAK